jgi:hypothetical protein
LPQLNLGVEQLVALATVLAGLAREADVMLWRQRCGV